MRAIILAGGKGTRLYPFTTLIPKPLVPIGEKSSILEIILKQLKKNGFDHITLAVNHQHHLIMSYFGNGDRFGLKIDYSIESEPLSTIGPLTLINDLPDNFLVMNGDILCDLNYAKFITDHTSTHSKVTVASFERESVIDFGVLEYDDNFNLSAFREKPSSKISVSMGIYCISKDIIDNIPKMKPYGFDNLMLDCIKNKNKVKIMPFNGFWLDIGRTEDYDYANSNYLEILKKIKI